MNSTTTSPLFRLNSLIRGTASAVIVVSSLALLPYTASAQAIDSFMKVDGIKGDSNVPGHRDEINISGFTMGVDNPVSYGPSLATIGKPQFYEVRVAKKLNATSPLLFDACATGKSIPSVVLSLSRSNSSKKPFDFFRVVLTNVTVTRVSSGASAETSTGSTQDEELALSFQKIEWIHRSEDPTGKLVEVKKGFDLGLNAPAAPPRE